MKRIKHLTKWKGWPIFGLALFLTVLISQIAPISFIHESGLRYLSAESADVTSFRKLLSGIVSASGSGNIAQLKEVLATHANGFYFFTRHETYDEVAAPFQMPQFSQFLEDTDELVSKEITKVLVENEISLPEQERIALRKAVQTSRDHILEIYPKLPIEIRKQLLQAVPPQAWERLLNEVNGKMAEVRIDTLPGFDRLDITRTETSQAMDPKVKEHLGAGLRGYFREMPLSQRRAILLSQLDLEMDAPLSDRIAAILEKTGPVIQKLFQLIGKEYPDPLVKLAALRLAENLEIIPIEEVHRVIQQRYGKPITELFKEFDPIPIGSATIGQVHRAVLKSGETVAVKVRRPNIVQKVNEEIAVLKRVSPAALSEYWELLSHEIAEELDLKKEAAHLKRGNSYTRGNSNAEHSVQVPRLFRELPAQEDVIISEFMNGTSLKKLSSIGDAKTWVAIGEAFSTFAGDWFWRAVGKDGFAHADLHDGNLRTVVESVNGKPHVRLSLIDFGSSIEIPAKESNGFMALAVAIRLQDEPLFQSAIQTLTGTRDSDSYRLAKGLLAIFRDTDKDWKQRTGMVLYELLKQKAIKTASIVQLNRGLLFLDQHLRFINEQLDRLDPNKKEKRFSLDHSIVNFPKLYEMQQRRKEGSRGDGYALDQITLRNIFTAMMRAGVTNAPETAWSLCKRALRIFGF